MIEIICKFCLLILVPAATTKPTPKADIMRYVRDADFVYQDFARRGTPSEIPTFRAQDYSWEEQGYSLANRLYAEIGTLMDDKFKVAYNLTYYTWVFWVILDNINCVLSSNELSFVGWNPGIEKGLFSSYASKWN